MHRESAEKLVAHAAAYVAIAASQGGETQLQAGREAAALGRWDRAGGHFFAAQKALPGDARPFVGLARVKLDGLTRAGGSNAIAEAGELIEQASALTHRDEDFYDYAIGLSAMRIIPEFAQARGGNVAPVERRLEALGRLTDGLEPFDPGAQRRFEPCSPAVASFSRT